MGGVWIIVELITKGKGVPVVLYLVNVLIILFDQVLLIGWGLLTEKINSLFYISMTMSKEFESIRTDDLIDPHHKFGAPKPIFNKEHQKGNLIGNKHDKPRVSIDFIEKVKNENLTTDKSEGLRRITTFFFDEKEDIDLSGLIYFIFQHIQIVFLVMFQTFTIY
jgi:hypothetical protein